MSARPATSPSSFLAGLLSLLLLTGVLGLFAPHAARADSAPLDPANPVTPRTVTADPLPTVQINGVAWAQVVVGNTVYVAGSFTRARPAGAAPGTQEVVRSNLLAYDIRTGELNPTFDPFLNGQAVSIAATPDGSRIYVGGDFTSVDGQARTRIAAFSTATGQLVPGFAPAFNSQVYTLAVTNTTVYGGGWFTAVGTTARRHVAAVSGTTGALLPWAPALSPGNIATPSAAVMGLTVTNGGAQVVMSGRFAYINGVAATGVGAVDAATGATRPFAVNKLITNQGANAGVYSLTSVGDTVYGTGYTFGSPGNFEGTFAAAADGGAVRWIHTCHGDTYSAFPSNGVVYQASHAHNCTNIGSFPEQNPQVWNYGTAVSDSVAGTLGAQNAVEQVIAGQPAPALLPWFPTFYAGSYTGQWQAGWSVTGNSQYVVYGGEFPAVNGSEQQGLVRFAVPELAPNKVGPRTTGTWAPSATMVSGAVRISWKAVADRDNENLTYRVYRDDAATTPVCEVTKPSTWWNLPTYACGDTAATTGAHRYLVAATDPAGNRLDSQWVNATVPASSSSSARGYTEAVRADGATSYWSLNEKSGTTAVDQAGSLDMTVNTGITRGRAGAIAGDADTAYDVNGTTTGFLATQTAQAAPNTFTAEAWFQTTTQNGGKILGFGNRNTGNSTSYDRHVYLDTAGRLLFGVNNGAQRTVTSAKAYNDGSWHHVAASLSPAGMALYVDGELVGSDAAVTSGLALTGYWRVGGDTSWSGAAYLAGRVDEVAVYGTALTPAQVKRHNDLGRGLNVAPTAAFTSASVDQTATVDASGSSDVDGSVRTYAWDFGDGATGTGQKASHTYAKPGTYAVKLTVTDDDGATGTTTAQVTVTAPPVGPGSVAKDAFGRTVASGWGTADLGGPWTIGGGLSNATVANGAGQLTGAAGRTLTAALDGVARRDVAVQTDVVLAEAPTGGGTFVSLAGRRVGESDYRATVRVQSTGVILLRIDRVLNGVETVLASQELPGRYTAGSALSLRLEAEGAAPTALRAKAWAAGTPEPTWQLTATDSSAALQVPGGFFVETYTSGSATRAQVMRFDNLRAEASGAVTEPVNVPPTASFVFDVKELALTVDGAGSTDPEGAVAGYAWDFGDGSTGTGRTAAHTYAQAGTYAVKLTVTDGAGATGTVTQQVTVAKAVPPPAGAPLASDAFGREVATGFGVADVGGAWQTFGTANVTGGSGRVTAAPRASSGGWLDVSAQDVVLQADVSLDRAATGGGTFVSFGARNLGATRYNGQLSFAPNGTVQLSLVTVVNWTETEKAAITLPGTYTPGTVLTVRMEAIGTGTTTLRAKAWTKGTTEPAWMITATDTTASLQKAGGIDTEIYQSGSATTPNTYRIDNLSLTKPGTVAEPANVAPTAAFTSAVTGLAVAVDGAGSTDPEGAVAGYAWDFGNGSTGTGRTATHTYAKAGTYPVKLTVTDAAGATGTVTKQVTVAEVAPPPAGTALVADAFGREVATGFGPADIGGAWQTFGAAGAVKVTGGSGRLTAAPRTSTGGWLDVSAQDVVLQADVALEQAVTGGGSFVSFGARNLGATRYNGQLSFAPNGTVQLSLVTVVNWTETEKAAITLPGTYTPGTVLTVRMEVSGTGTTTLRAKAWVKGTPEPAAWMITATDTTASLQKAGGIDTEIYQSGSATTPNTYRLDNLWVGKAGDIPPAA